MSTEQPASGKHSDPLRKATPADAQPALHGQLPSGGTRPSKVLCLERDARSRKRLEQASGGLNLTVHSAVNAEEFSKALADHDFEVVVISLDDDPATAARLAEEIGSQESPICVLLSARKPTVDHGILAMRCGAVDLIAKPFDVEELRERLASAAERALRLRQQQRRLERLKRICRRLSKQRHEANSQIDVLCGELVNASHQLASHSGGPATDPFAEAIGNELDVEVLLRKTLEHMLTRTGPTNAAVFLPGSDGDYSLGAYVNYNLSRDTADTLLDHLADVLPDKFTSEAGVAHLHTDLQLSAVFEDEAAWLSGSELLATTCRDDDGECLAVIAVFRESGEPFAPEAVSDLRSLRDTFARQLARVVRVHNRATPKAEWLGFDVGEEREDEDTGTDWGQDWGKAA